MSSNLPKTTQTSKWQCWDSHPGCLILKLVLLAHMPDHFFVSHYDHHPGTEGKRLVSCLTVLPVLGWLLLGEEEGVGAAAQSLGERI